MCQRTRVQTPAVNPFSSIGRVLDCCARGPGFKPLQRQKCLCYNCIPMNKIPIYIVYSTRTPFQPENDGIIVFRIYYIQPKHCLNASHDFIPKHFTEVRTRIYKPETMLILTCILYSPEYGICMYFCFLGEQCSPLASCFYSISLIPTRTFGTGICTAISPHGKNMQQEP